MLPIQSSSLDHFSTRQVPVKEDAAQKEKLLRQELFKKRQKEYQEKRNKKEKLGGANLKPNDWNPVMTLPGKNESKSFVK